VTLNTLFTFHFSILFKMDENKSHNICKYCNFILYVLKIHLNVMDYTQGCNGDNRCRIIMSGK
jgi:hypothetical protein